MNEHIALAIQVLKQSKSGDAARARATFHGCSPEEMMEPRTGGRQTRAEILAEYEAADAKIDQAIAYLRTIADE
jgi:hypothetical protein